MKRILSDLSCGFAAALLAVLQSAAAFSGRIGYGILAAVLLLPLLVVLIRQPEQKRRRLRSIAALLGYPPAVLCLGRIGIYAQMFTLINPEYAREYGIGSIGDAFGLIFLYLPAAWCLLAFSVLLTRRLSARKENEYETEHQSPP